MIFCNTHDIVWFHSYYVGMQIQPVKCFSYGSPWYNAKNFCLGEYNSEQYVNNIVHTVSPNSKLFFDSGSKYPRTKLKQTDLKRTIKADKCDFIVINEHVSEGIISDLVFQVFKIDNTFYAITDGDIVNYFGNDPDSIFKDGVLVYSGKITYFRETDITSLTKFLDGIYSKPFITDNDLDKIVSPYLPDLTEDSIKSLTEMLQSSDSGVAKIGFKCLATYNLFKYPLTVKAMISTSTFYWTHDRTTDQLRASFNIKCTGQFSRLTHIGDSNVEYSDQDIAFTKQVLRSCKWVQDYIEYGAVQKLFYLPDEYKLPDSD